MKNLKIYAIVFLIILVTSCKKHENATIFKTFIFGDAGLHHDYSIKFNSSDTMYIEKRFPDPKKNLYGILNQSEKDTLSKLIGRINFSNYNSEYSEEHLSDGNALRFIVVKNKSIDSLFIYGNNGPKVFYELAKWIVKVKNRKQFNILNQNIDFESLNYKMLPPPPPPPKIDSIILKNNNR